MDNINRMMHYPQGYGMGMDDQSQGGQQQPTSPSAQPGAGEQEVGGGQEGVRGHASINTILDQIMTITDQSLDEVLQLLILNRLFQYFICRDDIQSRHTKESHSINIKLKSPL